MLNLAAKALHEYVGVDHVGIVTINATSGETRLVAEYPVTNMLRALLPNDENSLTAMLQKSRREIVIQDIAHSEQITPELREILLSVGSRAMFLQPLLDAEGALLGSIGFDISQPYGMPDGTRMEFARTVAAQLALTMQKMRLYENTQRQAAQIQKINRFTLSLQVSQDLPTVLMGLVALARSLDPFDYVGLHLYDSQLGALSVAARYDNGALEIPQGFVTSDPDNNTPLQVTFTESNASLIGDLESDGLWTHPKKGVIRTLAVYPLVNQRRNIGAMEIGNKKPYAYTAGEFAVFQQLANQTATTLANALAFKQSSEQTQRKLRTTELATLMQQQNDISAMMRVTVESLAQMLGARRVSIRLGTNAPQTERK
jgi:GAF domain-containing protein